jgi:uncharacterized protein
VSFLRPLLDRGQAHTLVNERTGVAVANVVEAALDSSSRRRGLLGRDDLAAGRALILAPCNAVHTCFMRFPIDVIFVARDGRVLKIVEHLTAWRIAGSLRARATVELAAGQARRDGLCEGDRLVVRSATDTGCASQPR